MNRFRILSCAAAGCASITAAPGLKAQDANTDAATWLAKAGPVPALVVPASKSAWETQRWRIRTQLWDLLGHVPARPKAPDVKTLAREEKPDFRLEKFEFDNGAGATVPGYVIVPKNPTGKKPAILFCHWHGGEYDIGKEAMLQPRYTPEAPGPTLARRGFVVLGIDAYCFGERNGRVPGGVAQKGREGEWTASKFNLWVGRTLWGMMLRDDLMALDYLVTRPEVDPARIGVTGMSMGATRAWWLMALDDRIRTAVPVACMTRYQNLILHGNLSKHGIYYFVPGMLRHFDAEAVISLCAPRPVLFLTGHQDPGSPVDGIREIEAAVRPVYRLYQRDEAFQSVVFPGVAHEYTAEMWARTLAWMDEQLKRP
jgi:dienelactone hydrolase